MDSRSRRRIKKLERLIAVEREKRDREGEKLREQWRPAGRLHATAVAAIVLSGQPKIQEPLIGAWIRTLEHYGIDSSDSTLRDTRALDAARLINRKIMTGNEAEQFTHMFHNAPSWLLQFTLVGVDASLLNFGLPTSSEGVQWGREGLRDARRWPLLPLGVISAGHPVPAACETATQTSNDFLSFEDSIFLLDVQEKPEDEWSRKDFRRWDEIMKRLATSGAMDLFDSIVDGNESNEEQD